VTTRTIGCGDSPERGDALPTVRSCVRWRANPVVAPTGELRCDCRGALRALAAFGSGCGHRAGPAREGRARRSSRSPRANGRVFHRKLSPVQVSGGNGRRRSPFPAPLRQSRQERRAGAGRSLAARSASGLAMASRPSPLAAPCAVDRDAASLSRWDAVIALGGQWRKRPSRAVSRNTG
jgi:hypothetical protein